MRIKCNQCGRNLSKDKRFIEQDQKYHELLVCHNCKKIWDLSQPNPYADQQEKINKNNMVKMAIFMLLSLVTFSFGIVGILFSIIGIVYSIRVLISQKKILSIGCLILCILTLFASIANIGGVDNVETDNTPKIDETNNTPAPQDNVAEFSTEIVSEIEEPQETEEEYKASCQEISYKDVLRNPDNYVGQRVKIEIEVNSVHEASWLNNTKYYFGYSKDETYDQYWGNQYGVYDLRDTNVESWFKILDEDVIIVYGEVAGTEHTKSLILNSEELFVIDMKYAELIAE